MDDADIFIHLGDGQSEFLKIAGMFPEKKMLSVPGNSDWGSGKPVGTLHVSGKKILYTHGHTYRVKDGLEILKEAALANGAHIVLFGHTHISMTSFDGKCYLLNPGSVVRGNGGMKPSYGTLEITQKGVEPRIVTL